MIQDGPVTTDAAEFSVNLARQVTATLAPEEAEVFDDVADAWRKGATGEKAPGGSVGFGLEAGFVSEIVLQVISASIMEVLGLGFAAATSRWKRWRAGRRAKAGAAPVAKLPAVNGKVVMTPAQATALREVSRRHATTFGLTGPQADLLADAVVGAVHVIDARSPDHGES